MFRRLINNNIKTIGVRRPSNDSNNLYKMYECLYTLNYIVIIYIMILINLSLIVSSHQLKTCS